MNIKKLIPIIAAIGLGLIMIFGHGLYKSIPLSQNDSVQTQNQDVKVVSTDPDPLDNGTILPQQTMAITFNYPIENTGEIKRTVDPNFDYKIELSDDRKTVKITPNNPLPLGSGYTFTITKDTKFDNGKRLTDPINFHFKTISYRGI